LPLKVLLSNFVVGMILTNERANCAVAVAVPGLLLVLRPSCSEIERRQIRTDKISPIQNIQRFKNMLKQFRVLTFPSRGIATRVSFFDIAPKKVHSIKKLLKGC
jgi:hypothetical protein